MTNRPNGLIDLISGQLKRYFIKNYLSMSEFEFLRYIYAASSIKINLISYFFYCACRYVVILCHSSSLPEPFPINITPLMIALSKDQLTFKHPKSLTLNV